MIKKYLLNKINVIIFGFILLNIFYFIPTKEKITNKSSHEQIVYLLDKDNYVSSLITYFDENSIEDLIRKKIDILKNGSEDLDGFKPLIPKNTKLNKLVVDKDNVYIDFSKAFINTNNYEKVLESIVYTLTEINGINNIYITVEDKQIDEYPLTRSYGINREYDIDSLMNINKTVVYFSKSNNYINYYVPVTKINNDNNEKIEIIIKELKSSINSLNNLKGISNIKLISYKFDNDEVTLQFNREIDELSRILIDTSIRDNYNVKNIKYIVSK